ncbi:MAG: type IV pilus assembly protein PilB [Parcubacteria group bacterium Gr01-1014_19]|nr:MAG: type IV pilus assembly protein PilB [Parcubacteria group bacterium Gr01-1014_19]
MVQIPDDKLKEILAKDGAVSEKDFDAVTKDAKRMGQSVADVLVSRNFIKSGYYNGLLARYFGVELANLSNQPIDESALRLLSEDLARQKRLVAFAKEQDGTLDVAMADPTDLATLEFLASRLGTKVRPYLATDEDLKKGFAVYGRKSADDFRKIIEENIQATLRAEVAGKIEKEAAQELPVVSIVDNIVSYAISSRASDIHIEILEDGVLVRYRVDGILHEITKMPKEVHTSIVARLKLLSGLRLDEHSKPQDGRFRYQAGGDLIDIRVSVIPAFYGEKVEMRLLSSTARALSFEELGMLPDTIKTLQENIAKTYGIVLVTGPTGSGKSTTLYSMLSVLNKPEVNISTIEDPVEYDMKYINQMQVNEAAGITFPNGLRALLRQDPNIIMVGEIRDAETSEIAVQAALTGHLVLSTLHTNDAASAIPRLFDLKVEPFLAAAVLNALVAQRLVRKICPDCIQSYPVTPDIVKVVQSQMKSLGIDEEYKPPRALFRGKGCVTCSNIGYKGRIAIYEAFSVDADLRNAIVDPKFNLDALKKILRQKGFITMFEDGLRKVAKGMTTIEEVLRVIRE